ncbi:MAG TPA: VOC family protein [Candidatus Binatia bacterium]|nr:VOC family protein [Candidatus Binatia bacterium]
MGDIAILGLDHVVLRTKQLERVLGFYRDTLGCPVERTIEPIGLYQLRAGAALVDVIDSNVWAPAEAGPGESKYDHFCLAVAADDPRDIVAALDAAGIEHGDPAERYGATGNGTSIYAIDPDGRTVELKITGRRTVA